jgi:hypothetical protein
MMEQINQFMSPLKAGAWTYGLIGIFGLVLAAVGLTGVTAYSVRSVPTKLASGWPWGRKPST